MFKNALIIFFIILGASCSILEKNKKNRNISYIKQLEEECSSNNTSCILAGFIHKDQNRFNSSYKYFKIACNNNLPQACLYMRDVETNINSFSKDISNVDETCKKTSKPCIRLGIAYFYLEQFKNAESILLDVCKSGQKLGCYLIGQHYEYVEQTHKAIFFYNKACLLKYESACEMESYLKKRTH